MKKFQFTLARLKDYREQILETEKNSLGMLRRELLELQTELDFLYNLIAEKNNELSNMLKTGTTPVEIAVRKRFIASKQQEVIEMQNSIVKKEAQVEEQLQVVLTATRDVSTLEKLEENQLEEYRAAEQKENELFIEEFISNADFRKIQGSPARE